MAKPRVLPPAQEIKKLLDGGMTQAEVAEHLSKQTGTKVTRSAVSVALSRAGLTSENPRYSDELPWKVARPHLTAYPARMLRLLGRARAGGRLSKDEDQRLTSWIDTLSAEGAVVAYSPTVGFLYVTADEVGDGLDGIPIRRRTILDEELP